MEIKIRRSKPRDMEDCIRINESIWGKEWKDIDYLKERVSKNELLVAVNERNKVVGYIAFRRRYWNINYFIEEIAVEPENQRMGIGSMLVKELEKICSKDNASLFSSTDSENEKSIKFHEKNNFSRCGFIKNMFKEGKTEIVFSKKDW